MDAKKGLKSEDFGCLCVPNSMYLVPFTVLDLVKVPDLPQARVNKCLIALVNRKIVRKDNSTVGVSLFPFCHFANQLCRVLYFIIGKEPINYCRLRRVLYLLARILYIFSQDVSLYRHPFLLYSSSCFG